MFSTSCFRSRSALSTLASFLTSFLTSAGTTSMVLLLAKASLAESPELPTTPIVSTPIPGTTSLDPASPAPLSLLQPLLDSEPTSEPASEPASEPISPESLAQETSPEETLPTEGERVFVQTIAVTGSTVFSPEQLAETVQPFEGRELTLDEIKAAAEAITQLYLNAGYLSSRALPSRLLPNDGLEIRVVELAAELQIEWEGDHRLPDAYVRDRLSALSPLNTLQLEDQLKLLRTDPHLASLEANLRRNPEAGLDRVIVRVEEARNFYGAVSADNYSPPSIGGERFGTTLGLRNLSGFGDDLSASYNVSVTGGLHNLDLNYQFPLNAKNGTLNLQAVLDFTRVTQEPFDQLDIEGKRQRYSLRYRQPIIRTSRREFALLASFTYTEGQTFIFDNIPTPFGFGPDSEGISRTSVIKLGQEFTSRDSSGAWVMGSTLNFGVDIFDATRNDAPIPDGRFFSWVGQLQRLQRLGKNHLLIGQLNLQLTPNSLLPSEQFVIGGGESIRGYRQNALIADNGFRFSLEDRITIRRNESSGAPSLQLAPFFDLGGVINAGDNPNSLTSNQTLLTSLGLGVLWTPQPNIRMRLDYGYPLVDLETSGESIQDTGLHFSGSYEF